MHRLRSTVLLRAAEFFARLFSISIFKPTHEIVRLAHAVITRPVLSTFLKAVYPQVVSVQLRHSQTMFGHFHFLLSDVDVTLVIEDTTPEDITQNIASSFERLRSRALWLGEVEIYTRSEFEMKKEIERAWPSLIELIRVTRKFSWNSADLTLPYHGYKSSRSLARNEEQFRDLAGSAEIKSLLEMVPMSTPLEDDREQALASFLQSGRRYLSEKIYRLIYYIAPTNSVISQNGVERLPLPALRLLLSRHEEIQTRGRLRMLLGLPSTDEERAELARWAQTLSRYTATLSRQPSLTDRWLEFDVHGCRVRCTVETETPSDLESLQVLAREFQYFRQPPDISKAAAIVVRVGSLRPSPRPSRWQVSTRLGHLDLQARDLTCASRSRTVSTDAGTILHVLFYGDKAELNFRSRSLDESSILVNAVHATLGEALEKKGFLRLHAAAYETSAGAELVFAKAGVGKSTFAHRLLKETSARLFTDETTWTDTKNVYPYPVPIAINSFETTSAQRLEITRVFMNKSKSLMPIPEERVAPKTELARIIAVEEGRFREIKWLGNVTLGLGLAQMAPYLLRPDNCLWLPRLALRRFAFAVLMLMQRKLVFQTKTEFRNAHKSAVNPH